MKAARARHFAPWLLLLLLGATGEPGHSERERFVQRRLEDARAFEDQGRLDGAERALERALGVDPDHARANRLMAQVLEAQGRGEEAARYRARADVLDPPPPPPPDAPLDFDAAHLRVALVDPAPAAANRDEERRPATAQQERLVSERVATRLPGASFAAGEPSTVAEANRRLESGDVRAVLSLRTDRAYCTRSRKDGEFGVARVRVVVATRESLVVAPTQVRQLRYDPPAGSEDTGCPDDLLARALERAFTLPGLREALSADGHGPWSSSVIRALYPGLSRRVAEEVRRGRAALATGRLREAVAGFQRALAVDPDDRRAQAYLREAEETLAISQALAEREPRVSEPGTLDFRLTASERNAAQSLLAEERRRRDELLAALVIAEVPERTPPREALLTLRALRIEDATAPGPRLARARGGGPIDARALYDSDGRVRTVYYFGPGGPEPRLREDRPESGAPPRAWIAYRHGVRSDLWEDRSHDGEPDTHVVFGDDGEAVEQIAIDDDADGNPERVFHYAGGRLLREQRDTNGDGRLDRLETFDGAGAVVLREEDLTGDGRVDLRTHYENGRLVRREVADPDMLEALLGPPD